MLIMFGILSNFKYYHNVNILSHGLLKYNSSKSIPRQDQLKVRLGRKQRISCTQRLKMNLRRVKEGTRPLI